MPRKDRITRRLDLPAPVMHGAARMAADDAEDLAPPIPPDAPDAPTNLALTTLIQYSTASPLSSITGTWLAPSGGTPERYVFQVSESSSFPDASTVGVVSAVPSATIGGLRPGILYYARVAAVRQRVQGSWSATASITTAADTAPAGVPTSPAAAWIGFGDLLITWVNPTEANFETVEIVIRASSGGTIYCTAYRAGGSFLYTLAMNYQDTGGVGDSSLYVELRSLTFSNIFSATVNTGLVTKSAPATPAGVSHTWSGDAGTAGADWSASWTRADDAYRYRLAIDSVNRQMTADTYNYPFALNKSEHAGTADPVLTYSLVAVDGFGQISTAATGTATNAAPAAPTATLTEGAVSGLYATVTSTPPADFWRNEFVFKRDGTTVATVFSTGATYRYEMQGANDGGYHSWTVVVRQEDLFAQFSATHTPSAVAFEGMTLSYLRDDIVYGDSLGTAASTLKAALADGDSSSGGQSYNA